MYENIKDLLCDLRKLTINDFAVRYDDINSELWEVAMRYSNSSKLESLLLRMMNDHGGLEAHFSIASAFWHLLQSECPGQMQQRCLYDQGADDAKRRLIASEILEVIIETTPADELVSLWFVGVTQMVRRNYDREQHAAWSKP